MLVKPANAGPNTWIIKFITQVAEQLLILIIFVSMTNFLMQR
jgi:hypothetical protein